MPLDEVMRENARRNEVLRDEYEPLSGRGCRGDRVPLGEEYVPRTLTEDHPEYASLDAAARERLRIAYDFEYWCARCVTVKDKLTGALMPFTLNSAQRKLLDALENQREAGKPIRAILLKARQWGGSTLTQVYMAWIQIVHRTGWNSIILSHQLTGTLAIKRMLANLVDHYPAELLADGKSLSLKSAGSPNVLDLQPRGCTVILGSSRSEDAVRGNDLAMAHLSEVAFWREGEDVVRSVSGAVARLPLTVVVMESTANGTGNLFHDEWSRAVEGRSDKVPVFVAWHEIEIYRRAVDDAAGLIASLDDYEEALWDAGLTLEMIAWYHDKRAEYGTHAAMQAEYPTTPAEAFATSASTAVPPVDMAPAAFIPSTIRTAL